MQIIADFLISESDNYIYIYSPDFERYSKLCVTFINTLEMRCKQSNEDN